MSQLSSASIDQVVEACRRKCESIAETFNQCFGTSFTVRPGEPEKWAGRSQLDRQAGLLVTFRIGDYGLVVAVPATIPLPAWYAAPGDSERSRLDTLPMEWSLSLFPDEFVVDQYECRRVEDLSEAIAACQPTTDGTLLPLSLVANSSEAPTDDASAPSLLMIWPVANPDLETEPVEAPATMAQESGPFGGQTSSRATRDDAARIEQTRRTRQIVKLKVPVIVKLAEKRIQLGQLLALGPGAIVTFEKSCEDLLDLCINNQVYCRGEAVKIGEKFGLKVNEIAPVRIPREPLEN